MPLDSPMSLKVTSQGRRYKSIVEIDWPDIPPFAILTGRNGAGKSQLLELVAFALAKFSPPGQDLPNVHLSGTTFDADEVGYIPSGGLFSDGASTSIADLGNVRKSAVNSIQQLHDIAHVIRGAKIRKVLGIGNVYVPPQQIQEIADRLPDDFEFALDLDAIAGLAHVFLAYRVKKLEAIDRGTPGVDHDGRLIGPAPWEVINDAFATAGFAYEVVSPEGTGLLSRYELLLEHRTFNRTRILRPCRSSSTAAG